MSDLFYFGYDGHLGHHLYNSASVHLASLPLDFPVSLGALDGGLLPPMQPQQQGWATMVHVSGWTIISFWDRSGDKRGNSCSVFLMRGIENDFGAALARFRKVYPRLFERFDFEIRLRD